MGLTVYYTLKADRKRFPDFESASELVSELREFCLLQEFENVGDLILHQRSDDSFTDRAYEQASTGERILFSKSAEQLLWVDPEAEQPPPTPDGSPKNYIASDAVCFHTMTVSGSESASLGLASYPGKIGDLPTTAEGCWYWQSFSKTQYASQLGEDAFIHAHTGLISILDYAKEIGFEVEARDDGFYWETRDETALKKELQKMNQAVAAFAGMLKDHFDEQGKSGALRSPIFDYPNFEHLEAEGRPDLEKKISAEDLENLQ